VATLEHCVIWTRGAISDDGYGSITRFGREHTVQAQRFAVVLQLGIPARHGQVIEHLVRENPICVRIHPAGGRQIWPSTQAENLGPL
jgi:hypothetical protein